MKKSEKRCIKKRRREKRRSGKEKAREGNSWWAIINGKQWNGFSLFILRPLLSNICWKDALCCLFFLYLILFTLSTIILTRSILFAEYLHNLWINGVQFKMWIILFSCSTIKLMSTVFISFAVDEIRQLKSRHLNEIQAQYEWRIWFS